MSPFDYIMIQAIGIFGFALQATVTVAVGALGVKLIDRAWEWFRNL